jgi:hypothetical protein
MTVPQQQHRLLISALLDTVAHVTTNELMNIPPTDANSSGLRPNLSIKDIAATVASTFTTPTMIVPRRGVMPRCLKCPLLSVYMFTLI